MPIHPRNGTQQPNVASPIYKNPRGAKTLAGATFSHVGFVLVSAKINSPHRKGRVS